MVPDDVRGTLVHEGKGSDDDMGRDSRLEKREDIRDEYVVLFRYDNLPETLMEIVVVAFRLSFIFLGPFDSREGFRGFRFGGFGLLFRSSFRATFVTFEIIKTIESHIGKY